MTKGARPASRVLIATGALATVAIGVVAIFLAAVLVQGPSRTSPLGAGSKPFNWSTETVRISAAALGVEAMANRSWATQAGRRPRANKALRRSNSDGAIRTGMWAYFWDLGATKRPGGWLTSAFLAGRGASLRSGQRCHTGATWRHRLVILGLATSIWPVPLDRDLSQSILLAPRSGSCRRERMQRRLTAERRYLKDRGRSPPVPSFIAPGSSR